MPEYQPELTDEYFDYLAQRFPVMCASDEFHFLPRAVAASRHYDRLDDFDRAGIEECIATIEEYRRKFGRLAAVESDPEKLTDLEMLDSSIAGILIELDSKEVWRHDPLLYLKIAFIGLDHSLTKPTPSHDERLQRTRARLQAIPRLLQQAAENIDRVAHSTLQAALAMLVDCRSYLSETADTYVPQDSGRFTAALEKTRSALDAFGTFLGAVRSVPDREFAFRSLEVTLRDRFRSHRSLSEVDEIAVEEWRENLCRLERLQRKIDPGKSWRELYHGYLPEDAAGRDTLVLYDREMKRLKRFFESHGFSEVMPAGWPVVCRTPTYLQSVRGSASFSAAFSRDGTEEDYFYITTQASGQGRDRSAELLRKRFHREYKFLAAHETFPGHYLLDSTRRMLDNPVRSQIESALFYEGWAYYVESLLTEYGYADHPLDLLVDCKRRLWRAARCRIDIGLHSGRLSPDDALGLLTTAGFGMEEACGQISRFRLNPGYQLCYSLGRFEIMRLRETYAGGMGHDGFHRLMLEGGEPPFHAIEKRLRNAVNATP
ncbi:DUF885 family protein [Syntrophobacter fumaroxidans]|uniref:DUF885 domain-containing protein n=1 Tax=Syntrophobacter fumaroxidans (strain DSM 10017 / MPOB) TaxID=335543 RepID=A0LQD7_SYNFM|nr:DUF885 family protein [Syntrophobacter fumaroxidans]ABK19639.1 protein of unknown function DUF885 [Syntrophobacter fumaroxidans MPOB]